MERTSSESVRVKAVLSDEVYRDTELVPMLCAEITDKKQTSAIIKALSIHFPLPEFTHLKRVKGGDIPRVLVTELGCESECSELLHSATAQLESLDLVGLGATSVVRVPRVQPITRSQYNRASQAWPTHFHEDKLLEKTLRGEMFSSEELLSITHFMKAVLNTHGKDSVQNEFSSTVMIVDPDTKEVMARGDTDPSHPLKHATMLCLDRLASAQGGGAWHSLSPTQTVELERQSSTEGGRGGSPPAKQAKLQYLCTGYDTYCTAEPCLMCSMALLHSRISRVFFCYPNTSSGGVCSQYRIHTHSGLNHHFQVFMCTLACTEGDM